MKQWRRRLGRGVVTLLTLSFWLTVSASAQNQLWATTKAKMTGDSGYSMRYDYEGPEGVYKFNYVVQGDGDKVLTEVLDGSQRGAGSRILYDPASDKENVTMQTRLLTLRRSLQAKDIRGSSLYQPLFRQLVEELVEPHPREVLKTGNHTVFVFGDKAMVQDRLEVDQHGNPRVMRRIEKGKELKSMTFHNVAWGHAAISWP